MSKSHITLWICRAFLIVTAICIPAISIIYYEYYPGPFIKEVVEVEWFQTQLGYGILITGFILVISTISWFWPVVGFTLALLYSIFYFIFGRGMVDTGGVHLKISTGQINYFYTAFLTAIIIYAITKQVQRNRR